MPTINTLPEHPSLREDYEHNFMPRKEFVSLLTLEQILNLLDNRPFQDGIRRVSWHWNFFVKIIMLKSLYKIIEACGSNSEQVDSIGERLLGFYKQTSMTGTNETRAIIFTALMDYFPEKLSDSALYEAFWGTDIYDDHCARTAYELWIKRKYDKK